MSTGVGLNPDLGREAPEPPVTIVTTVVVLVLVTAALTAKGALFVGRPGATVGYLVGMALLARSQPIARWWSGRR